MNELKTFYLFNNNQILSISIWTWINNTQTILSFNFDSSYQRLERLLLSYIEPHAINLILPKLMDLPRLFSLTIQTEYDLKDFGNIYRFIYNLTKLKYFKCKATDSTDSDINISLPIASNKELSSIEHLTIDHPCSFNQLVNLISYTPQINYLKFLNLNDNQINLNSLSSMKLTNLTDLSIESYHMTFDTFEIFLNQLNLKLKIFSFKIHVEDNNYLNVNRWEQIILRNLSELEEFYFKYIVHFQDDHQPSIYSGKANEFCSSFWFQRQWILEIEVEYDNIFYSIHPYNYEEKTKKKFLSSMFYLENDAPQISNPTLTIDDYINRILPVMQIDHLNIQGQIFIVKLGEILCLLPELDSLKFYTISFSYPRSVIEEDLIAIYYLTNQIKITKVSLGKICRTEEAYFFIALCPFIKQLHIDCLDKINIEVFLRSLLMEIQSRSVETLRLLCCRVPTVDDHIILKLEKMIQNKNLLCDFTIKRLMDKIYVQWK